MKAIILAATAAGMLLAQSSTPVSLTISQAVEAALRNYPSVKVSQEQVTAAAAGIRLARTAYLPRADAFAQVNRATRNNILGMLLTQSTLPSISGPVLETNNFGSAWGSAVGMLVTWEPFDFGLRGANVAAARAVQAKSEASLRRSQFDVAVAAADAYLTLAAAQETVRAAQAGVDRSEVVLRTITALVKAELRPGADESRAKAELAAARTQAIQAQQAVEIAHATVSQFVGLDPAQIGISTARLVQLPPEQALAPFDSAVNPIAAEQASFVNQEKAQLRVLERSYFPKFQLQGAAYARGSGAKIDGSLQGGLNGLAPNIQNYGLGFSVTFPILDLPAIRAKEAAQSAVIRAQAARSQQIAADLRAQWQRAVAALRGSRKIAENTPVQVTAARTAAQQATARYQTGLGTIDAVAEAQRLLTQAEIDDVLARLGVWRGLLGVASATGDLQPFLASASQ